MGADPAKAFNHYCTGRAGTVKHGHKSHPDRCFFRGVLAENPPFRACNKSTRGGNSAMRRADRPAFAKPGYRVS